MRSLSSKWGAFLNFHQVRDVAFLRDIGKDLFELEHSMMKSSFKKHRTRTHLRKVAKKLREQILADTQLSEALDLIQTATLGQSGVLQVPPPIKAYLLTLWALDSNADLDGIGFPFDRAQLAFFDRINKAWESIENNPGHVPSPLVQLRKALAPVIHDKDMSRVVQKLRDKVKLFDQLREAMRIALPNRTQGLNDDGTECDINTIRAKVTTFRDELAEAIAAKVRADREFKKMLKQINKYWDKLFADPILVATKNGNTLVQPQRTNNLLERFFRDLKKGLRKKSGASSMTKALRTMLVDTPLIKNIQNESYMEAILSGEPDLQTRFAQIDSASVRQKLRENLDHLDRIPAPLKKLLRTQGLPAKITQYQFAATP